MMSNRWNQLPTEVILKILHHIPKRYACLYIGKNWHVITLFFLYKSIDIDLLAPSPVLTTLLSSRYRPGRYVYQINIDVRDLPIINNSYPINTFHPWTNTCPNVKEINILRPLSLKQWNYVKTIICQGQWNLSNINYPFPFTSSTFNCYLDCVSFTSHSLKRLQIGVRTGNYTKILQGLFPTVTTLDIMSGVLRNMIEYDRFISQFTNLEEINAHFNLPEGAIPIGVMKRMNRKIKTLNIKYTVPISNMDLRLLTSNFSRIENLNLSLLNNNRLLYSSNTIQNVFRHLSDLPNYDILFIQKAALIVSTLTNYYHATNATFCNSTLDIHFLTGVPNSTQLRIQRSNNQKETLSIIFTTNSIINAAQISNSAKTILSNNSYLKTCHFFFDQQQPLNRFLQQALSNLNTTSTTTLTFTGGMILPIYTIREYQKNETVTDVTINQCNISWLESLNSFLIYFSRVSLTLKQCKLFQDIMNQYQINVSNLSIKSLSLYLEDPNLSMLYMQIVLEEKIFYYLLDTEYPENHEENISQEIEETTYSHNLLIPQKGMMFIRLSAKSLETFVLCYHDDKFTFDLKTLRK